MDKEALALVFGLSKFCQYLYHRAFILQTDHKPLTTILGPTQGIPSLVAARLQCWAIQLLPALTRFIFVQSTSITMLMAYRDYL